MNPHRNTYSIATPTVYSGALVASLSSPANQTKPVRTITGPSRLSGRARHEASPQPISDAPTRAVSNGPGPVGRGPPAGAASQVAPIPAAIAAEIRRTSFARMLTVIVASIARRG